MFDWLSSKYHEVSEAVLPTSRGLTTIACGPELAKSASHCLGPFVWFFFEPETVSRDSYYFHNTPNLVRDNDTRSFSCMYTDFQLASFNSQLFFSSAFYFFV